MIRACVKSLDGRLGGGKACGDPKHSDAAIAEFCRPAYVKRVKQEATTVLGVRLDAETELALDAIARRTRRPKSQIAREAIRSYVLRNDVEARARAEWRVISDAERNDAETNAMLDAALRDLSAEI